MVPLFEYYRGTDTVGVDVEIARRIASDLGVQLQLKHVEFENIISSLSSGKCDIAVSGITITEWRKKEVDFSIPYYKSEQYLILRANSPIAVMEDLAGKTVGVLLGYIGQFVLEDEMDPTYGGVLGEKGCELKMYKGSADAKLDIIAGRLDAVIVEKYVAQSIVAGNSALKAIKLTYADGGEVSEEYGVAIPKGNAELLARINKTIETLKADKTIEQWVVDYSL